MESYVINLDKRGDRWRKIDALCKTANLPIKRIKAIDGKTELITDEHWLQKYDNNCGRLRYMTKGEIACYLSHYKCYEESKSELTLVIEDDAKIPIMFDYNLNKYLKYLPHDWDIILLGTSELWARKWRKNTTTIWQNNYWFKCKGDVYGTQCYILKRKAIEFLKDCKYPINSPIDVKINHLGLNVYILNHNMVGTHRWGSDTQG